MQKTKIGWTQYTSNPVRSKRKRDGQPGWACTKVSPECAHCYAEALNLRLGTGRSFASAIDDQVEWVLVQDELKALMRHRGAHKVFVGDMTDLFHERVPDAWLDQLFAVAATCPHMTFQILTKRAERLPEYFHENRPKILAKVIARDWSHLSPWIGHAIEALEQGDDWPLPNVWLGVSVGNQQMVHARIPSLLRTPAVVRFLSIEPLLGPMDLTPYLFDVGRCLKVGPRPESFQCGLPVGHEPHPHTALIPTGATWFGQVGLDWAIIGGESGPDRRRMQVSWMQALVDQCQEGGVPVYVKQDSQLRPGQQGIIPDELWALKHFPTRHHANTGRTSNGPL